MAVSTSAKRNIAGAFVGKSFSEQATSNSLEEYDVRDIVLQVSSQQATLDNRVHAFLEKVNTDEKIAGNFNVNEEWRCWLENDVDSSYLLFDEFLESFDDEAVEQFNAQYARERDNILSEYRKIEQVVDSLDEYRQFKTAIFNVFNNSNNLPFHFYIEQVYSRAQDYNMTVERHSKDDFDFIVSFNPFKDINRGYSFFVYELYMRFNPNYKKECHVYSVCMMDVYSSELSACVPVDLPVVSSFRKFNKDTDAYFLNDHSSVFYRHSLREHRKAEKERFNIPSDFFEAYFADSKNLVDFSDKSYRYGNSNIFIPKSQVAFAGDKVYMKHWLYAKLKKPIERHEAALKQAPDAASLDDKVRAAKKLVPEHVPLQNPESILDNER